MNCRNEHKIQLQFLSPRDFHCRLHQFYLSSPFEISSFRLRVCSIPVDIKSLKCMHYIRCNSASMSSSHFHRLLHANFIAVFTCCCWCCYFFSTLFSVSFSYVFRSALAHFHFRVRGIHSTHTHIYIHNTNTHTHAHSLIHARTKQQFIHHSICLHMSPRGLNFSLF